VTSTGGLERDALVRFIAIALGAASMVVLVLMLGRRFTERDRPGVFPPVSASPGGATIAAEADVFRLEAGDVAVAPVADRRVQAHRRTLAMFRTVRAFPGAPPRIPHGLTAEEFRHTECNACHERGGWVRRFSAYAPVTPHPEFGACLQCHAPDDRVVGIAPPTGSANSACLQCHAPGRAVPIFVATSWRPAPWPATNQRAMPGSPPSIPHRLELRGNCLACHMGAAAVEEIRTDHPERANCRQCHTPAEDESVFTRPGVGSAPSPGGER
jgi:cytochrome c-type protein NapB